MHAEMAELSVWSEDALNAAMSQRDAQNPQGEEEENFHVEEPNSD